MNTLVSFIKKNPSVLTRYVELGVTLVDKAVTPLNKLMSHLLEVQGIDPHTQPGERDRKALESIVGGIQDPNEYDSDFDFSRFHNRFKRVKSELKELNLSKDQYKKMTDLTNVSDATPVKDPAATLMRTSPKPDLNTKEGCVDRINLLKDAKEFVKGATNPIEELAEAVSKAYNKHINETPSEKVSGSRQPTVVGGTRATKGKSTVIKTFKNGLFRRVETKK